MFQLQNQDTHLAAQKAPVVHLLGIRYETGEIIPCPGKGTTIQMNCTQGWMIILYLVY